MSIDVSRFSFPSSSSLRSDIRQQRLSSASLQPHDSVHFGTRIDQKTRNAFAKFFVETFVTSPPAWKPEGKWHPTHLSDLRNSFIEKTNLGATQPEVASALKNRSPDILEKWVKDYIKETAEQGHGQEQQDCQQLLKFCT